MNLRFACLMPEHFDAVCAFYDEVIAQNTGSKYDVLWRRDLHPSDAAIASALEAGELYGGWMGDRLAVAGIFNQDFAEGYDAFPWRIPAEAGPILCLHLFATHPDFFRQGLAKRYLEQAMTLFREQGIAGVRLDVFATNVPARKLYESAGFELIEEGYLAYEDQEVSHLLFGMYELSLL